MTKTRASTGIGAPVRRREDQRLLTGQGRYSDDLNLPDQAYAVMVRSPTRTRACLPSTPPPLGLPRGCSRC